MIRKRVRDKFNHKCFRIPRHFARGNDKKCKACKWRMNCLVNKNWVHKMALPKKGTATTWMTEKDGLRRLEQSDGRITFQNMTNETKHIKEAGCEMSIGPNSVLELSLPF